MSDHGGLTAIHPYEIARHWWLHEGRNARANWRVHRAMKNALIKQAQRELCKLRREYYGKETRTAKPVAKKAKG